MNERGKATHLFHVLNLLVLDILQEADQESEKSLPSFRYYLVYLTSYCFNLEKKKTILL